MPRKYKKITSVSGGVIWLGAVNDRIHTLRAEQHATRDKAHWFRIEEQLKELYDERRYVSGQMNSLELKPNEVQK